MTTSVLASPQQINLYSPALLPPRHAFSARQFAAWVAIAALALAALAWWAASEMRLLNREIAQQGARAPLQGDAGPTLQQVTALEQALRDRQSVLESRRAVRDGLRRGMAGPDAGPSAVLRRLADTIPPTAWLVEVRVSGSRIEIKGRALDPAAVDTWLGRLRTSGFLAEKPAPALRLDRIDAPGGPGKTAQAYSVQLSGTLAAPFAEGGSQP